MTHNIDSVLNPPKSHAGEDIVVPNVTKMIALHELKLAKKVSLELIRDCPNEVHASLEKAFDKAILELT